jgi:AcrR family transcriptional regulator
VPRNRRPQDREQKQREIVDAALALFTQQGYDGTSVAQIARAAGITPNTVYWYVEDKDALLVAALDRLLGDALADLDERTDDPLVDQVLWVLERLRQHHRLVTVVHARAAQAPAVAVWHEQFHALVDALVADKLRASGIPESDLGAVARLGVFAVEGLLAHPTDAAGSRDVLRLALGEAGTRSRNSLQGSRMRPSTPAG